MRRIKKGPEPTCMAELRGTPGANWTSVSGAQKQKMREQAFAEQGGLCAYCMSRLPRPPGKDGMKIEHFETRAWTPGQIFDWGNLLGVCLGDVGLETGGEGDHRTRYHCDTYRGYLPKERQPLDLSPAAFPPDVGKSFSYTTSGEMRPAPGLEKTTRERAEATIDRLNLNIARLQRNRGAVIDALRSRFREKKPTPGRVKALLDRCSTPDADGLLQPYCQTAIDYLTKKLRQLGP